MNTPAKTLIIGALLITPALAYGRYRQYPLPNPSAQQQRARCIKFFAKPFSINEAKTFLKKQGVDYSESTAKDVFTSNIATDFQLAHKQELGSALSVRVRDIEKPLCGKTDALFIVSFTKKGQLLKVEHRDVNWGCLDF